MAAAFPLQTYLDVLAFRLERATADLQRLNSALEQARGKLHTLQGYQREYQAGLVERLGRGLPGHQAADYRAFLGKLERAVAEQGREVQRQENRTREAQAAWLELRRQQDAIGVLRERHLAGEAQRELRLEQKEQDEFAARAARGRPY